jgi:chromate transporter
VTPAAEVFLVFLRLGLTSFGGPVAHLGYFRAEFVTRRRWMTDAAYADLVALAQFLPGPASSQVGIAVGYLRAGVPGALLAWLAFTLPSAAALAAFAFGVQAFAAGEATWLRGLAIVAVAVVAQAVWGMARSLTPDPPRITIAVAAAAATLGWPGAWTQIAVIAAGAILGLTLLPALARAAAVSPAAAASPAAPAASPPPAVPTPQAAATPPAEPGLPPGGLSRLAGAALLIVLAALLIALPIARDASDLRGIAVADAFFRTGAIVFGGGHVVLPLLRAEVAPLGIDDATFTAGYGAAQAVPGPLFTFAAYLGASLAPGWAGVGWATLALLAVFVPSFLLMLGALPFWDALRVRTPVRRALAGVNAAVVGLLLAAWYDPVFTTAIATSRDFALSLAAFAALAVWRLPPWLVVLLAAGVAALLGR